MFLLSLRRTMSPTPAPVLKPAMAEPKLRLPDKYSCVIIIDDAQFGINPISAATAGCNMLSLSSTLERFSSPIK